jgi:hypothetical protein
LSYERRANLVCSQLASSSLAAIPFGPLFPEFFCMMVTLGLARQRVQPCPRKKTAISSKLLALSLTPRVWLKAKG